ncbi:MAG TPA: ActS/PrrB/RegB family redox-sensitive histidine kinase [Devosia sp.]|nr:ActS/PrrB/RegB family redox-sensitive histidine kinase [Devosia sp.]
MSTSGPETASMFRPLRLSTLVRLRWLALAAQTLAVLYVAFGLGFPVPLFQCLTLIAISAVFNIGLVLRFGIGHRPTNVLAAAQLAFDSLQLAGLLWLTGGLENPFAILLLAPVSVSASILPIRETILVSVLAAALTSALALSHMPLPWHGERPIMFEPLYIGGIWIALLSGYAFVAVYAGRVAHEARQLADALAATELALSRQQRLSELDGLAAAAAHELGTPLSTIALAAKEMLGEVDEGPLREDVRLIIEQSARCRNILSKLRSLDDTEEDLFRAVPLSELLAELTQPFTHYEKPLNIIKQGTAEEEPVVVRNVGLLYGLGNLIENAAQFARSEVTIEACWQPTRIKITITDDGPGFAPDLLNRLGEPYLSAKGRRRSGGLGLGVFIAKTLLERTGAKISFSNAHLEGHARVALDWIRTDLEAGRKHSVL